jgi:decaprenyl-phosphate phosphoribosyltransferase
MNDPMYVDGFAHVDEHATGPTPQVGVARALLTAVRPRQWVKNVLVLAAAVAAGHALHFQLHMVWQLAATFASFCAASSAGYLLNDTLDVTNDRAHPRKRNRPIASGALPIPVALAAAAALAVGALLLSWIAVSAQLALVVLVYLAVTGSYSLWLKREPVLDLAFVAAGFVLRAIAGGVAVGVPLSQWFLLVASFGSLFMVAGKRYADVADGTDSGQVRINRPLYSASYLRLVLGTSAATMVVFYVLWSVAVGGNGNVWAQVSVAPFVLAVMRYGVEADQGKAGAPEEVVLSSRTLQGLGLLWLITFSLAAYTS